MSATKTRHLHTLDSGSSETTMSFFTKMTTMISTYLSPRKKRNNAPAGSNKKQSTLRSLSANVDEETITVQPTNTPKRKASARSTQNATKKLRLGPKDEDSDLEGSTLLTSTSNVSPWKKEGVSPKEKVDRRLMPPPSIKKAGRSPMKANSPQVRYPDLPDLDEKESMSQGEQTPSRNTRAASSPIDLESMSSDLKARYQAAITLPENSGIWAEAERDLFFRLALRGFEPLLPPNWMIDFPTYPLALFSSPNSPAALLQSLSSNDFRATKALKSLNEMGSRIRDRALAFSALRPEPIISSTVSGYIDWALLDAKVHPDQRPNALPVHVITSLQKGQSTHDAITAMTAELHELAAAHRELHNIGESVERDSTPASDETHVLDDGDSTLPILTGLMICSSLVVVVTLNACALPLAVETDAEETGLRFIATFDFGEGGMDVWNALAVAIVGMHIRKVMLTQQAVAEEAGEAWEFVEQDAGGTDDPDA